MRRAALEPARELQWRRGACVMAAKESAAAALADLFFLPGPCLSDADKMRANELRAKYRSWRSSSSSAVPHADVLDLKHEAITSEWRSRAKMKRVQTVGSRLHELSPVRAAPIAGSALYPGPCTA